MEPSADAVCGVEFSAVCLPKLFAMHPCEHSAFLSNGETAPAKLAHFRLDFGHEHKPVHQRWLDGSSCEFPSTHPNTHGLGARYTYLMANARGAGLPFRDIVKVDEHAALQVATEAEPITAANPEARVVCAASDPAVGTRPAPVTAAHKVWFSHGIVGEPIFIPRVPLPQRTGSESSATAAPVAPVAEDDGWLFVQTYVPERHTTDFVILDARDPQNGPLAIIHLKHHVCYGFHGTFTPHVFFQDAVDGVTVRDAVPPELRAKL